MKGLQATSRQPMCAGTHARLAARTEFVAPGVDPVADHERAEWVWARRPGPASCRSGPHTAGHVRCSSSFVERGSLLTRATGRSLRCGLRHKVSVCRGSGRCRRSPLHNNAMHLSALGVAAGSLHSPAAIVIAAPQVIANR